MQVTNPVFRVLAIKMSQSLYCPGFQHFPEFFVIVGVAVYHIPINIRGKGNFSRKIYGPDGITDGTDLVPFHAQETPD